MRRTELGKHPNEGARKAWAEIERRGWDQSRLRAAIAKKTGRPITSGALVRYLYCDQRPGVVWAEAFRVVLGVQPLDWHRDPAKTFLPPAAKRAAA